MNLQVSILKAIADNHGRYTFRAQDDELDEFQVFASHVIELHAAGMFEVLIPHYSTRHTEKHLECVTASSLTLEGEAWLRAQLRAA